MSQTCGSCDKTVYEKEKIEASNKWWHKGCFKCPEKGCGTLLTLKTFQAHEGKIFCAKHVPQPKATSVADSVASIAAKNAPKKSAEGLHKTDVSNAEFHGLPIDAISSQTALNAPKKLDAETLGFNKSAGTVTSNARRSSGDAESAHPAPQAY